MSEDWGIQCELLVKDKPLILRFARPDFLMMDEIQEAMEAWRDAGKEGKAPKGFFKEAAEFLGKYAPPLCFTTKLGVISDGGKREPEDAEYFLSAASGHLGDFDAPAQMEMFLAIAKSVEEVGTAVSEVAARLETFREPPVPGQRGPSGGDDEPPSD